MIGVFWWSNLVFAEPAPAEVRAPAAAVSDPSGPWSAAAEALAAADYPGAAAAYTSLLDAGYIHPDVYYNLGNVLYQAGDVPRAVVAWRRAAVLAPRDPDIAANLDFARRKAQDGVVIEDPVPWFAPWQSALSVSEGLWVGAGLAGLGLLLLGLRHRVGEAAALGLGGLALVLGGVVAAGAQAEARLQPVAVVLPDVVPVTSDLGGGIKLFELHAGAEVGVLERAAGRSLLVRPTGEKGWVADTALGWVDPWAPMPGGTTASDAAPGAP